MIEKEAAARIKINKLLEDAMATLKAKDGTLAGSKVGVSDCTSVLNDNLARRDSRT